jgi:hypothetical protein
MPTIQTPTTYDPTCVDIPVPGHAISGRQCPICRSWETQRHVEGFRVWFTCNRCGGVFS